MPNEQASGIFNHQPAVYILVPPLLKPNRRKTGTLIIKGLLRNLDHQTSNSTVNLAATKTIFQAITEAAVITKT